MRNQVEIMAEIIEPRQDVVTSLHLDDENRLVVGMGDYRVRFWDLKSYMFLKEITGFWEVRAVSSDEDYYYIGTLRETIEVLDKKTFEKVKTLRHDLGILHLFTDGFFLYSCSHDGSVKVFDLEDLSEYKVLTGHMERANCTWSDDNFVFVGEGFMMKGGVSIYDAKDFKLVNKLQDLNCKRINAISGNKDYLFLGHGSPPRLTVWDRDDYSIIHSIDSFNHDVIDIQLNTKSAFIASKRQLLKIDLETMLPEIFLEIDGYPISRMAVNDRFVFLGSGPDVIGLDANSMMKVLELKGDSVENIEQMEEGDYGKMERFTGFSLL